MPFMAWLPDVVTNKQFVPNFLVISPALSTSPAPKTSLVF
jgi:hypothetical protein